VKKELVLKLYDEAVWYGVVLGADWLDGLDPEVLERVVLSTELELVDGALAVLELEL
jgi:hypothetical protein